MPRNLPYRVGRSQTGLGLFATAPIEKCTVIVEYRGRRIPTKEARKFERRRASKYMFEIDSRWTIDGIYTPQHRALCQPFVPAEC